MSIDYRDDDSPLFLELLRPLVKRLRDGELGAKAALAIYRAGYTMLRVGEWLVYREAKHDAEANNALLGSANRSVADGEALIELVMKRDTGAPFPPLG